MWDGVCGTGAQDREPTAMTRRETAADVSRKLEDSILGGKSGGWVDLIGVSMSVPEGMRVPWLVSEACL